MLVKNRNIGYKSKQFRFLTKVLIFDKKKRKSNFEQKTSLHIRGLKTLENILEI